MSNTNHITTETLNNIAKLIQSVGVAPTKEMVISLSIKTLIGDIYDSLRAAR